MSGQNPNNRGRGPGEFELIERYFAPLSGPGAFNLGDDGAVLTPRPGEQLVFTADAIIAGVHFLAADPGDQVAEKLVGVNLSDLAAMGAKGLGYLITTAWPRDVTPDWIAAFADGLGRAQAAHDIYLLGGDTVATDGPLSLSLTAIGTVPQGSALRRNGAGIGDGIYVSGLIGDAGVGLRILRDGMAGGDDIDRHEAIDRYRRPKPRLQLGQALRGLASACIDVSDGLVADLGHLSEQSKACMRIDLAKVPLSPLAGLIGGAMAAVTAGDDYELLFTAPAENEARVQAAAREAGVSITLIGRVDGGQGVEVLDDQGQPMPISHRGYRHFR